MRRGDDGDQHRENGFEAVLLIAALRGNYQMTGLAGGDLVMSIPPSYQKSLLEEPVERVEKIDEPIPPAVQEKLYRVPEFRKAYDPQGLSEKKWSLSASRSGPSPNSSRPAGSRSSSSNCRWGVRASAS